ncbi:MAG TPA: cytochrome P450 [Mucilaginibacter sp.]|jgi:cytochrome P450|nr:cytochrome P450 [Mucilaginibacter sp.]
MNNTILSWEGTDYRAIYLRQLKENPLYYDRELNTWVAYSYSNCKAILEHVDARIPELPVYDALNEKAGLLTDKLVRLSNGEQHGTSRAAAMSVFQKIKSVNTGQVLQELLAAGSTDDGLDWVAVAGKQLPVRLIMQGLNFDEDDSNYLAENLQTLVLMMKPNKTKEEILLLNPVVDAVFTIAEKYSAQAGLLTGDKDADETIICNLIGLIIQCYDAGRGLLCNTLLAMVTYADNENIDWKKLVIETLRHDPPVHNTRRVAAKDITIGGQTIKAGETILVVLAAANLDDAMFVYPETFDLARGNSDVHLTFGLGGHNCLAKYFCIDMASDVCQFLAENYQQIHILQKEFMYEPQLNVRLVKQLMVSMS